MNNKTDNIVYAVLKPETKKLLTAINLTDNLNIGFMNNGIEIRQIDNSSVAMQSTFINASEMQRYNCPTATSIEIANSSKFSKILKTLDKKQDIEISISATSISITDTIKIYKIPITITPYKEVKEPNLIYDAVVSMPIKDFTATIKDAEQISSYITLNINGNTLNAHAKGDAGELNSNSVVSILKHANSIYGTFDIAYIKKALKDADAKSSIELYMKANNEPLKMVFQAGGIKMRYILAPYMES